MIFWKQKKKIQLKARSKFIPEDDFPDNREPLNTVNEILCHVSVNARWHEQGSVPRERKELGCPSPPSRGGIQPVLSPKSQLRAEPDPLQAPLFALPDANSKVKRKPSEVSRCFWLQCFTQLPWGSKAHVSDLGALPFLCFQPTAVQASNPHKPSLWNWNFRCKTLKSLSPRLASSHSPRCHFWGAHASLLTQKWKC